MKQIRATLPPVISKYRALGEGAFFAAVENVKKQGVKIVQVPRQAPPACHEAASLKVSPEEDLE